MSADNKTENDVFTRVVSRVRGKIKWVDLVSKDVYITSAGVPLVRPWLLPDPDRQCLGCVKCGNDTKPWRFFRWPNL